MNASPQEVVRHVRVGSGPAYWALGDRYTFLATGAQTNGEFFVMEATVAPGGGPPPHLHHREQEAFYILEGTLEVTLGDRRLTASAGDFVHFPRGVMHGFCNTGSIPARMLVLCVPSGLEKYFEEVFEPVEDRTASPPPVTDAMIARLLAAGPKYGIEFRT